MSGQLIEDDGPDPIDKHVGARVNLRRRLIGMSQEQLGRKIGVSFQQVQKYLAGVNRISASRLYQIADVLGVNVGWFFEDAPKKNGRVTPRDATPDPMNSPDAVKLVRAYHAIEDEKVRRKVLKMVRAMAPAAARAH